MGNVVTFPTHHARACSKGYRSGRNSWRGTPLIRSTAKTRKGGTLSHWDIACAVIPIGSARLPRPPTALMARSKASFEFVMAKDESIAFIENQALLHCGPKAALYNLDMSLGKRIQQARKRLNISQRELGEHFGISPAAVSSWERNETIPEFGNLCRMPDILKVPADWLLTGGNTALPNGDMIRAWNRLSEPQQRHALRYLEMLGEDAPKPEKPHRRAS